MFAIFTRNSITGTSVNTPTVVASAAGEVVPNRATATATANSKKLDAPIIPASAAMRCGSRKPSNMVTIQKIADALNTTTEYLLGSSGTYVVEAHEKGGAKAAKDIEELVSEVTGMFTGGELSEDAIEGAYKALTDAYWIAKENNKKYAPKTRRKKSDQ